MPFTPGAPLYLLFSAAGRAKKLALKSLTRSISASSMPCRTMVKKPMSRQGRAISAASAPRAPAVPPVGEEADVGAGAVDLRGQRPARRVVAADRARHVDDRNGHGRHHTCCR